MKKWSEKVVLVTGGSAGLGLEIARAFGMQGATSVILGRDETRLENAVAQLKSEGISVESLVGDVAKTDQVSEVINQLAERHGRLDVLVNNVGKSIRADLDAVTVEDFRDFLEVNFLSAVACTRAALPWLKKSDGHVVNMGSLAAKTAWPFVAPYSASKFALASYTHQLRLEGPKNVHYMLVCPGPIKRSDAGVRYHEQVENLPDAARLPAAGAKVKGIDPQILARRIVKGCDKRWREIILPFRARFLFTLLAYSPPIGDWLLRRVMRD